MENVNTRQRFCFSFPEITYSLRADEILRLRNSAEILVLDFQLCTQIWVRATIGQLKKAFVLFVVIANQVEGKFETHFR